MTAKTKSQLVSDFTVVGITAAMVGAAELLCEKEIVFPEIAALAVGAISAPKRSWRTSRVRCVLFIAVCAALGLCVSVYVPLPAAAKLLIAYAAAQLLYLYSGTSFAPMISAAALPVLMGTDSLIYPISAVVLTALIMAAELILTKIGLHNKESFSPLKLPEMRDIGDLSLRTAISGSLISAAIIADWRFCVAPPLLVAFTEFSKPDCAARKKPVRAVLVIALCALAGAVSRGALCVALGLPLTLAAVCAMALALVVLRLFGMFLPPAGALAILPMIIPQEALLLYPLQILLGAAAFMCAALLMFREGKPKTEAE